MKPLKVTHTNLLLWNSLRDLVFLENKDFERITINDICKRAAVHRSTFYNHFQDKYDLFTFGYRYYLLQKNNIAIEKQFFYPFTIYKMLNEQIHLHFFHFNYGDSLHALIYKLQREEMGRMLKRLVEVGYHLEIDVHIAVDLFLSIHMTFSEQIETGLLKGEEADEIFQKFLCKPLVKKIHTSEKVEKVEIVKAKGFDIIYTYRSLFLF